MRLLSAFQIKQRLHGRKVQPLQLEPAKGTLTRKVYDQLLANLGKPIPLLENVDRKTRAQIQMILRRFELFYGLDIRLVQHGSIYKPTLYALVGEWFGPIYVDYVSDTEEQMDRLAEARYALQHAERVENILPAGVHHLSKDSIEILERVAEHGRKLAEKHTKGNKR